MVMIALTMGLRWGEIRALKWENILFADDLDDEIRALYPTGVIIVKLGAEYNGVIGPVKTPAANRPVPMPTIVSTALRDMKENQNRALVFATAAGHVMDHANIRSRFWLPALHRAGLIDAAGKARFKMHHTRHFAVSNFIEQGIVGKELTTIIGHTNEEFTRRKYYHLFPQTIRATSERADAAAQLLLEAPASDKVRLALA